MPDPAFLGVLWRSLAWAALTFLAVLLGLPWLLHHAWGAVPWWGAGLIGAVVSALAAFLLFVPVAAGIAAFYTDRVAAAVERRFQPGLPPARGAAVTVQGWDAAMLGLRVLAAQLAALLLTLVLPGFGWALGWAVSAWALGRGLFMAVAMRRTGRQAALARYHAHRLPVVLVGAALAAAGFVPGANLLVPVIGIAAMVHLLQYGVEMSASFGESRS